MSRRPARGEAGFTLVELVVAITVEVLVVGALGMAFVGIMKGTTNVSQSLDRSGDARIAAHYIISDARDSSGPETSLTDTTSCGPNTGTPVVRFNWNSTGSGGGTTPNIVDYVLVGNSLMRRQCANGSLVSNNAVASSIASVSVACSPTANCSGTPSLITATITEVADSSGNAYQYSLTGAFRKVNGAGPPVPKTGVLLLGAGNCTTGATGLKVAGGASVQVYGIAKINSTDGSTCKAMQLGTNAGNYQAGDTQFLSGGSCAASGSSSCPTSSTYSPAIADPYATLPALPGVPAGACSGSNPTPVGGAYPPGVYPTLLNISSPGATMSGTYIFCNGLSITNGATVTGSNVLLYFKGGSMLVNGNAQVSLSGVTSGAYKGLIAWQPAANTTTMTFSNGGTFLLDGTIYAPGALVNFTGGAVGTQVTSIVSSTLTFSGGATVTFGKASPTPLSITGPATMPAWTVNRPYPATTISGNGGDGNYLWSSTTPPAGLSFDTTSATVSGTPTAGGSFTVTLSDQTGDVPDPQAYTVTINAAPSIPAASLPNGNQSVAYSTTLAGSAGTAPYTWSATGLPAGLTMTSGGVISGTPTANGTSTVAVTLTDSAGATISKNLSLTINPTISSVTLTNGSGTPGRVDQGDTITIVYSAQMKVSSFCSTWSNDAIGQSLVGNSDVTVSVSNANPDVVTVTSATCTFNLGSINLAANGYTSVAATFKGNGANKSTIAWTASTHTLVITLGSMATGTVAPVASSTPIYTASGSIQDSGGLTLGNSPFTLAAGQQF